MLVDWDFGDFGIFWKLYIDWLHLIINLFDKIET